MCNGLLRALELNMLRGCAKMRYESRDGGFDSDCSTVGAEVGSIRVSIPKLTESRNVIN